MRRALLALVLVLAIFFLCTEMAHGALSPAQLEAKRVIYRVWGGGYRGQLGVAIARCESTYRTWAKNGQHLGLFQMGSSERAIYGHGSSAYAQARAALNYYRHAGTSPWNASRSCWS